MLSRRIFLTSGAIALALAPRHGLGGAPAVQLASFGKLADTDRAAGALVVHAPELAGRRTQIAGPAPAQVVRCLRGEGLATFALGPAARHETVDAVRRHLKDRRVGLIWWGATGALPEAASLACGPAAVVFVDRLDLAALDRGAGHPSVLCHFARRRSPADRRAIELKLATVGQAGGPLVCHWYDAPPGFAAPGPDRLDRGAELVWRRTARFLARALAQAGPDGSPSAGLFGG